MESQHPCRPPESRQPHSASPWTCPDCGAVWDASPHVDPDHPPIGTAYDFEREEAFTPSRWVRRQEDAD